MNNKFFIIAIDGPAASGKGTLAKNLATELNFAFLPTGNIYRAVAIKIINRSINVNDLKSIIAISREELEIEELYNPNLSNENIGYIASIIAQIPEVRAALIDFQRNFPKKISNDSYKGLVIEGRDIATTIFPDANIKLYVTADLKIRAKRRYKELRIKGIQVIYRKIIEDLVARDKRDQSRTNSPLKQAEEAVLVDTTHMDEKAAVSYVLSLIKQ